MPLEVGLACLLVGRHFSLLYFNPASLGNPLFLIKARMQAYSPALPVGTQHYYKNAFHALSTIIKAEGARGLVRGIDAAILRTSMGSSVSSRLKCIPNGIKQSIIQVQLPSYNWTKTQLVKHDILPANSTATFLVSSSVSGACVVRFRVTCLHEEMLKLYSLVPCNATCGYCKFEYMRMGFRSLG